MTLAHQAMYVGLLLAAPLLLVALVVGLVVSLFQAATQINESTLSFIPKLLAIAVTMVIAGPWMLTTHARLSAPDAHQHSDARQLSGAPARPPSLPPPACFPSPTRN